jgi:L-asparaginase II
VIYDGSPGFGIAIKISDGDAASRARTSVGLTILKTLGVLDEEELKHLEPYGNVPVKNWRGKVVGEVRPVFSINKDFS